MFLRRRLGWLGVGIAMPEAVWRPPWMAWRHLGTIRRPTDAKQPEKDGIQGSALGNRWAWGRGTGNRGREK
uniref:Uncharacterized protein n=1 Tax=Arundo donax TaxID=35708 RepID=A0A0A9BIV7_ARUDO